jgi:hypothetical protein
MLRSGCPSGLGKARGTVEGLGTHQHIIKVVVSEFLPMCLRVENKHGWMLVSHALAYVTASKNGISEPEIEDLISLDDKVFRNSKLTTKVQDKKGSNSNLLFVWFY